MNNIETNPFHSIDDTQNSISVSPPPVYGPEITVNQQSHNLPHQNGQILYPNGVDYSNSNPAVYGRNYVAQPNFYQLPLSLQRQYRIQNNYPTAFIIFHSIFLMILCLAKIGIEVFIMYSTNKPIDQIGGGFYSGGFLILTTFITLTTISCRSYCMIVTSVFFHLFGLVITFVITIVFHTIAMMQSDCGFTVHTCGSDLVFILSALIIAIGLICVFMCLTYAIYIQIKLVGGCSDKRMYQTQASNQYALQSQTLTSNANLNANQAIYNQI